ncbi:MAG: hypothetical protein Q9164_005828 [Protoblastenia rupestris]
MHLLCVTTSAVTVATLAARICLVFSEWRSLCRSLPGRMHASSNEIADIELVLQQVASVFKERGASISEQDQQAVSRLLAQAESKLSELQVTAEELARVCRNTKNFPYQAYTWRKEKPKLRELQEDIHSNLQNLSHITCQATSQNADRRDALQEELLHSLAIHDDTVKTSFDQVYSLVDGRIAKVEEMLQAQANLVQSGVSGQPGPVCRILPANRRRPLPPELPARSEGV